MCGAAALSMVYRALGIETTQEMIWEQIAREDGRRGRAARTYLLAQNALRHGLSAVGVPADRRVYSARYHMAGREALARAKDFIKSILKPNPTFLGQEIPISGDGRITRDQIPRGNPEGA